MTVRKVLIYPDPALKERSADVASFDDGLAELVNDMAETMYAFNGVGLAANQIGVHKRVVVMDINDGKSLHVFINPVIVSVSDNKFLFDEGCLSFPDVTEKVARSSTALVTAYDQKGKEFTLFFQGLESRCVQHEVDHLNGIVLVDKLGRAKKRWITKSLKKRKSKKNLRYALPS